MVVVFGLGMGMQYVYRQALHVGGQAGWSDERARLRSAAPTEPGRWYYVLYLNGRRIAAGPGQFPIPLRLPSGLRIGTWYKSNQAFRGLVDEVRMFTHARGEQAIRETAREYRLLDGRDS